MRTILAGEWSGCHDLSSRSTMGRSVNISYRIPMYVPIINFFAAVYRTNLTPLLLKAVSERLVEMGGRDG